MRSDPIPKFVRLHNQLTREKKRLENRLAKINRALSAIDGPRGPGVVALTGAGRGRRNAMSLREAITRATTARALTKPEIYEAVEALGYRFAGKDPMNSINVQLYTKGQFKRQGKKFSPASVTRQAAAPAAPGISSRNVRLKHKFPLN